MTSNVDNNSIPQIVQELRSSFDSHVTKLYDWRLKQLKQVINFLEILKPEILSALKHDLGKCSFTAKNELNPSLDEAKNALAQLKYWMKPKEKEVALISKPGRAEEIPEPKGVVLIIGAWNFPVDLMIHPLVGALAAGNCVLLKPSEVATHTAHLMELHFPKFFDPKFVRVVTGGVDTTTALLKEKFDHIFYTGNSKIGRIVMKAASRHLTPVTLELGGKSPAIIFRDTDVTLAARRVIWGKTVNAGQICLAPDYVLVEKSVSEKFFRSCEDFVRKFFGDDPKNSPDFERIVNERHLERLCGLMEGQKAVVGGTFDVSERYMAPTIVIDPDPNSPLMQEEIFGPILPILTINSVDEAIDFINKRPKPLAIYVFSSKKEIQDKIIQHTSSGAVVTNDIMMHFLNPSLPFGGVGESGLGSYHGKHSFDTFSHHKPVLRATMIDIPIRYPPYTPSKIWWTELFLSGPKPELVKQITCFIGLPVVFIALWFFRNNIKRFVINE